MIESLVQFGQVGVNNASGQIATMVLFGNLGSFGALLNAHLHFHWIVIDGVRSRCAGRFHLSPRQRSGCASDRGGSGHPCESDCCGRSSDWGPTGGTHRARHKSFDADGPKARAVFENGRSGEAVAKVEADLLIAADGIHSTVRATLYPDECPPCYPCCVPWRNMV